jgi:hypothetical protein
MPMVYVPVGVDGSVTSGTTTAAATVGLAVFEIGGTGGTTGFSDLPLHATATSAISIPILKFSRTFAPKHPSLL